MRDCLTVDLTLSQFAINGSNLHNYFFMSYKLTLD